MYLRSLQTLSYTRTCIHIQVHNLIQPQEDKEKEEEEEEEVQIVGETNRHQVCVCVCVCVCTLSEEELCVLRMEAARFETDAHKI